MQKISPFLWFDTQAEDAMNFYTSVFKDARKGEVRRYGEGGPGKAGEVFTCSFELFGQTFMALNGGPVFNFNESVSFFITCHGQEEVDYYWDHLTSDGGKESRCGWLKDKFGVSWQVVPDTLGNYLNHPDKAKAAKAMQAMMQMTKLDIAAFEEAVKD